MKRIFLISFLMFAIFSASIAQQQKEPKTPEERAAHQTERLTKTLSLTPDQASKTKAILLDNDQKIEQIRSKYQSATDKKAMHSEIKTVREQTDASLQQVFTPEQFTQYQNAKDERKQQMKQGKQGKQGMRGQQQGQQ